MPLPPRYGAIQVIRRLEPTVVNIKPRLPSQWHKSEDPDKRREYSRVQLLLHKPFLDRADYDIYMTEHNGDFIAAYEHFASSDALAPARVRDDFRDLNLEVDGDPLQPDELPHSEQTQFASDYSFYRFLGTQHLVQELERSLPLFSDWGARTQQRYSAEQVNDADRWMQRAKAEAPMQLPPVLVDIGSLNVSQRFVYNVVAEHVRLSEHSASTSGEDPPSPLLGTICGTAGSGKTYLIGAMKQLLGSNSLVFAPTGVAADNIGGSTYQSKLPMPRDKHTLDVADVRLPVASKRLQQLEADFVDIKYIIVDEMSMVGRRSLGQIDELLRQAKGNQQPFGGISVLLVGDHGQLPPVKDHRAYDWEGVRHRIRSQQGRKLDSAPYYQYHGTKMYELLTENVFFLDKVERVGSSDDPVEAQLLDYFRELQLRARDGELTVADYEWMCEHMDASKRRADFVGHSNLYRLVTTRALRDTHNLDTLERLIRGGAPGISIPAVHSGPVAERIADDEIGLARTLLLGIGARVMIVKNISVEHGLTNGMMGTVFDVICNTKGDVVSALLRVKRRTIDQRGYAGHSFLEVLPEGEEPLADDEAIIALDRWTETVYEGKKAHTRSQFPVMLAFCVTIHKAQGLTLEWVLVDAGPDERSVGQLFVAITRTRHFKRIAFDPMPSLERVTSLIACKPSLYERKRHEYHLRSQAHKTAQKFRNVQPVGFEVGALPPKPSKFVAPDPSHRHVKQSTLGKSWQQQQDAKARQATVQRRRAEQECTAKRVAITHRAQLTAKRQLEQNESAISRRGLPLIHDEANGLELPAWLQTALPHLKLSARVVDYLPSARAAEVHNYLRRLGFDAELDTAARQIGNTCGVVSAWVAVDLMLAHLDELGSWMTTNTAQRFDPHLYRTANPGIGLRANDSLSFISGTQTMTAAQNFWIVAHDSDAMQWFHQPEPYDFALRQIIDDLYKVAIGEQESLPLSIRTVNTDDCRRSGTHWFTVAYSIERIEGDSYPLHAVVASANATVTPLTAEEERNVSEIEVQFYAAASLG